MEWGRWGLPVGMASGDEGHGGRNGIACGTVVYGVYSRDTHTNGDTVVAYRTVMSSEGLIARRR